MLYFKFNLLYKNLSWSGSKICKKKDLFSPQWLRNIKTRRYPLWRLDIFFSRKKYNNIEIIKNGGWHFTNIKTAEEIHNKMKSFLHHFEYENSGINPEIIERLIKDKKALYNYNADQRDSKWSNNTALEKINLNLLPDYINENKEKYKKWLS